MVYIYINISLLQHTCQLYMLTVVIFKYCCGCVYNIPHINHQLNGIGAVLVLILGHTCKSLKKKITTNTKNWVSAYVVLYHKHTILFCINILVNGQNTLCVGFF